MNFFKKAHPLTMIVELKYGNRINEFFDSYESAMKKLRSLDWESLDLIYEDNIARPEEVEKLTVDLYKRYTDSEWQMIMQMSELMGAEIKYRC